MNIKPRIEEVKDYFSKAIEIAGNWSGKPQIIDTETHGIYWDGLHYRQCQNEFGCNATMLWSKDNGFSEILKVKPELLKDITIGQKVFIQPLGNKARNTKSVIEVVVTDIKRKYFSVNIGRSNYIFFEIETGIQKKDNYSAEYKAYASKYEAESATFSNDVRNEIVSMLNKTDYNSLLKIKKILKGNENNK